MRVVHLKMVGAAANLASYRAPLKFALHFESYSARFQCVLYDELFHCVVRSAFGGKADL